MSIKKICDADCQIRFRPAFDDRDSFTALVEHFIENLPEYVPDRWNIVEPFNKPFDLAEIMQLMPLPGYNYDFLWKRVAKPKGWGHFCKRKVTPRYTSHAEHSLFLKFGRNDVADLTGYLRSCASQFGVEYAFCDSMVESYRMFSREACSGDSFYCGFPLQRWLPDLRWAQVFGPAYVRLFGLEKLLSAPAYKVEQLGPETVYLQLSESLFDMHDHYEAVDAERQKVKAHLDDNIFFDPKKSVHYLERRYDTGPRCMTANQILPEDHIYRTPVFEFK
jgi:hypothetical protein